MMTSLPQVKKQGRHKVKTRWIHAFMIMDNFQPYRNPSQSRLEQWRSEIIEMRSLNWPYPAIAKWLLDEKQLEISTEAIRQFCRLRNIGKGAKKTKRGAAQSRSAPPQTGQSTQDQKSGSDEFTYDSRPIDLYEK